MLAIIPARAGSKGVPGKNRRQFSGKPLIEWTLWAAKDAICVSKIAVTTDDEFILDNDVLVRNSDFMIQRPRELSGDDSPAVAYIQHALELTGASEAFEYFCVLQPTSPLRFSTDIDNLYYRVVKLGFNSGVTVVEVPHNFAPESLMRRSKVGVVPTDSTWYGKNLRQNKDRYFARNGAAVYICKTKFFLENKSLFDREMAFWEMPFLRSVDIDTEEDFKLAELIKEGLL